MAKKSAAVNIDFAFFEYLTDYYRKNKGTIRKNYREPTKRFLDYNNREMNATAYLRTPQFEALEIYVYLKEYLKNRPLHLIFEDWYHKKGKFEGRADAGVKEGEQIELFGNIDAKMYKQIFADMKKNARGYPNYIYALTMGVGKTILMGTCIFYEFILADRFPKDTLYCHNALVFAPDKTVLQSLRELAAFDKRLVIPPEYADTLEANIKFNYLEEAGTTLNTTDRSDFNLIVSNTQKIILKKQHKEKSPQEKIWEEDRVKTVKVADIYVQENDAYKEWDELVASNAGLPEDEGELATNQRYNKLCRLEQLGIYVDEAHHAFGNKLAEDVGAKKSTAKTSLRMTIDELANELQRNGTQVVSCFNYTGTPYVGKQVLPEVVYTYGLKQAIDNRYLKKVDLHGYSNTREGEFVKAAITDFWEKNKGKKTEGKLSKIAFFAATIEELTDRLRPKVEKVLDELGIPTDRILVNVGDEKLTGNDEIREFNNLDKPESEKQFILLVNKGREGWNCKSLFAVAMYRSPRSKVFVLQATMRCLREIGDAQEQADVYLSEDNLAILDEELQQNFRLTAEDLSKSGAGRKRYNVKPVPPPVKIPVKRVRRLHELKEKKPAQGTELESEKWNPEPYRLTHTERKGLTTEEAAKAKKVKTEDLTHLREKRVFSALTLSAEIARYLNRSPVEIEQILRSSKDGMEKLLEKVNEFNEYLYDEIIPRLFHTLYEMSAKEETEETEIELVKVPESGYFSISANPDFVAEREKAFFRNYREKSFHLDPYCFDSNPEFRFFQEILPSDQVKHIYFTGMLTHGQSEFFIQYIDPETSAVRSYYPDFLVEKKDGSFLIVEIKGEHQLDDPVVKAKENAAIQMGKENRMFYFMIPGKQVESAKSLLGLIKT
jgi:hypothetical protein